MGGRAEYQTVSRSDRSFYTADFILNELQLKEALEWGSSNVLYHKLNYEKIHIYVYKQDNWAAKHCSTFHKQK